MDKKTLFVAEIEDRLKGFFGDDEDETVKPKDESKDVFKEIAVSENKAPALEVEQTPPLDEEAILEKPVPVADEGFGDLDKAYDSFKEAGSVKSTAADLLTDLEDAILEKPLPMADEGLGDLDKAYDSFKAAGSVKSAVADGLLTDLEEKDSVVFSPLKTLKSVVLSIEWELDDQTLQAFEYQVNRMIDIFANNSEVIGILRILRFLGKYIKTEGSSAHPDAIKLILEGYDDIETIVLSRDMDGTKKRLILGNNAKKYRDWVTITGIDKGQEIRAIATPERATVALPEVPDDGGALSNVNLGDALEEIRKIIQAEFQALRVELRLSR
jgi:hypothetical protein